MGVRYTFFRRGLRERVITIPHLSGHGLSQSLDGFRLPGTGGAIGVASVAQSHALECVEKKARRR